MDPAGPLWGLNSDRLSSADAFYVEVIHTDNSVLGYGIGADLGNVDFYVNGGNSQPGCITNICDHNRAWEVFASTVKHDHIEGRKCENNWQITFNSCKGEALKMGNDSLFKEG